MRSVTRGILFYSFVGAFFFTAAAILFYGLGYRYNPAKNAIERTGELIVESTPPGARVMLNGDPIFRFRDLIFGATDSRTPIHKKYLLPGTYHLELLRDGYSPYRRDISVTSGTVTIVTDPVLVSGSEPQAVFSHPALEKILVAASDKFIFLAGKNEVIEYSLDTHTFKSLYRSKNDDAFAGYPSPSRSRAVVISAAGIVLMGEHDTGRMVSKDLAGPINRVLWSDDEKSVFVLAASGIIRLDADGVLTPLAAAGSFTDMALSRNTLYALETSLADTSLVFIDAATGTRIGSRVLAPADRITSLETVVPPFVIGKDAEGVITSIDTSDSAQAQTPFAYVQGLFAKPPLIVVVASGFEAVIFEKTSGKSIQRRLLSRQSVPIQSIAMLKNIPYAIMLSGGVLEVFETAQRPDRNRYQVSVEGQRVRDFFVDANGTLHYVAEVDRGTVSLFRRATP